MKTRVILQDNLWFQGRPHLNNYVLDGKPIYAVAPRQGFTASGDSRAKKKELRWLSRYTGKKGSGLVIAQQWHKPGNLIDRNLQRSWISTFKKAAPRGKWCIFYDPILATSQRGVVNRGDRIDYSKPKVLRQWKKDLRYLQQYFDRSQYWRLNGGHPVIYMWAAFAMRGLEHAFAYARNQGLYVLADVLGTDVKPPRANGLTGFTVAIPGLERRRHRLPDLMEMFRQRYQAASTSGYDFIPAGGCQYDDVAFLGARRQGEEPLQVLAANRAEIETFLRLATAYAQPIGDTRYVFWGTMNNWAEGTTVLPTKGRGAHFRTDRMGHYRFAHLEAIRNVLFS